MAGQTDGELKSKCLSTQSQARICFKIYLRFPRREEVGSPVWTQEGALLCCSQSQVTAGVGDKVLQQYGCFFRTVCFECSSCHNCPGMRTVCWLHVCFLAQSRGIWLSPSFLSSSKVSTGNAFPDGHTTACRFC